MASTKAQIAKDKGNNAFKVGNWAEAIGHYSEAVITDRSNPTFPLNRAAAYLKLNKSARYQDAERDCTTVLSIEPRNVKAFFRRAQARSALERYADAEDDLLNALRIEPSNDSIKSELSSVQSKKAETAKNLTLKSNKRDQTTLTSVVSTNQPSTTKPTRRRVRDVPIEIVEPGAEVTEVDGETSFKETPSSHASLLTPVQSRTLSRSAEPPPSTTSSSVQSASTSAPYPSSPKPTPRVGAGVFHRDGKYTILRSPDSTSSPSSSPGGSTSVPQTHFAFARAWNNLKTSQERFELIQLIPPESLPALFRNNLETELLASILQTFLDMSSITPEYNSLILAYMSSIPTIPRVHQRIFALNMASKPPVAKFQNQLSSSKDSSESHSHSHDHSGPHTHSHGQNEHGHTHEHLEHAGKYAERDLPDYSHRNFVERGFTIGIGGPVGSGKTALTLALCKRFRDEYNIAVTTNDIFTQEDAEFLIRNEALPKERITAIETGGCPHAAIREDISANMGALEMLQAKFGCQLLFVESGGDNLAANYSRELADYIIYVIDVSIDLAPYVGASLDVMERDSKKMRGDGPTVFTSVKEGKGVEQVVEMILSAWKASGSPGLQGAN
ncbi:hypothetical protein Clacol_009976 [Clathrus columnatus]|uniref:Uncharacterized protein n=1 Tax=Clathrus columnatus TaxID=1419009 RepID=A0AAV5ARQ8_9AGAM|nr:hypothetical protein Clacol_009976 [Clathrus columnatus]